MTSSDYAAAPEFNSLAELCSIFMIPSINCTCQNKELAAALDMFPGLCEDEIPTIMVYEPHLSRLYAGIIVVSTLFGIFGNVMVVIVTGKNWKTSITYQKLIGQLGLFDLLFALLHLLSVLHLFWTNKWVYGETVCKILEGSVTLGSLFAVGLIFIISLERYIAIVHPFFYKYGTKKLNYVLVIINILVGIASVTPRFLYLHLSEDGTCHEKWPSTHSAAGLIYELYIVAVYFCIPLIAMFYLNFRILYSLQHNVMGSTDCLRDSAVARKMNCRIMRVLVSIIVAFTVLVMPNRVIMVYFVYMKYLQREVNGDTYTILSFLALIPYSFHVAINPLLYCVIDKSWRKQAFDVLCSRKFHLKYKCGHHSSSSIDGSNLNSMDVTRIKSGSFLHENRVNHYSMNGTTVPMPINEKTETGLMTNDGLLAPYNPSFKTTNDVILQDDETCYNFNNNFMKYTEDITEFILPDPDRETIL